MKIFFAPMEGITDGVLRRVHHDIFGGVDVYGLPFHKLTQTLTLTTREARDISPEENRGLDVLPQALTRNPEHLLQSLRTVFEIPDAERNGHPVEDSRSQGQVLPVAGLD